MTELRFSREMSVRYAAAQKQEILDALAKDDEVLVNLADQRRLDLAGAQLLYAALLEAKAQKKTVRLTGANDSVKKELLLCGIIRS
jgi:ABC-type transporter Mla MlaB component